jgi:hypothetical protein
VIGGTALDSSAAHEPPLVSNLSLRRMKAPVYQPRCLRMGTEGVVKFRVLVGERKRQAAGNHHLEVERLLGTRPGGDGSHRGLGVQPRHTHGLPIRADRAGRIHCDRMRGRQRCIQTKP